MLVRDLIVISDLHLSVEKESGLFQCDAELTAFLQWILRNAKGSQLVLNGDIFDFLTQGANGRRRQAFDVQQARAQVTDIIKNHRDLFRALGEVARSEEHQVAIVSGNHDPELALPTVQEQIESELLGLNASTRIGWSVHGIALRPQVAAAQILIEHGDQYDPWNRIDHDSVRQTVSMYSRGISWDSVFVAPPGSELVLNHLNELRTDFPWIDLLKPEVEAALPIILEMSTLKEKLSHHEVVRLRLKTLAQSAIMTAWRRSNQQKLFRADDRDLFAKYLDSIDPLRQPRGKIEKDRYKKMIARLKNVSQDSTFFQIAVSDEPPEVAILLMQGADVVIHGHTHAAKAHKVGAGLYLNSGTWVRLLRLPTNTDEHEWQTFLRSLEDKSFISETRPTFVRVQQAEADSAAAVASLCLWNGGPVVLSEWAFDPKAKIWTETYRAPEHAGRSAA